MNVRVALAVALACSVLAGPLAVDAQQAGSLTVQSVGVHGPNDLENALLSAIQGHAAALLVSRDALFANHIGQLVELASRHRLPTMFGYGSFAEAGGLIGYGPDQIRTRPLRNFPTGRLVGR